jgi:protein disulfide-isomerase A1
MMLSSLFLAALLGLSYAEDDEAVVTLTTENFETFIKENDKVLVEFYAPWCGHCKALAPEYEKAAQAIEADADINAKLGKVDATIEKDLATRYGVKGFPTLKFFNGDADAPIDYSGGRTEPTIIQWLRTRSMPAVTMLDSAEGVTEFKKKASVVLVGLFEADGDAAKALAELADNNRESVMVGQVSSADTKVDGTEFGKLYLCHSFDGEETMVAYDGELTVEGMTAFMNAERFPLIDAIGPENYKDYVDRGLPLVWISLTEEGKDEVVANLMPHAKAAKGKLSFTWVDAEKYAQHVQNLGITETPGLMISDEPKKYLFEGEMTADKLTAFFEGYTAGTLTSHMKSEPVPESNDGPVFVLVGSEFENVIGKDKDVFVEYYAPWCGHCKRLAPEYEIVGEAFSDVDSVVIAKMDSTENDSPEDIKGFPTLLFYPKGETTAVKYGGDRKQEAIIEWIKEHASGDMSAVKHEL